jgi:hypothetical protein
MIYAESRKHVVFFLAVFIALLLWTNGAQAAGTQVKVTAGAANIRQGPGLDRPVIKVVPQGLVLESLGKEGEWYKVSVPAAAGGQPVIGYIHQSTVQVVGLPPSKASSVSGAPKTTGPVPEKKAKTGPEMNKPAQPLLPSAQAESRPKELSVYLTIGVTTSTYSYATGWGVGVGAEYDYFVTNSLSVSPQLEVVTNFSDAYIDPAVILNYWLKMPNKPAWLYFGAGFTYAYDFVYGGGALMLRLNVGGKLDKFNYGVSYEAQPGHFFTVGLLRFTFGYRF